MLNLEIYLKGKAKGKCNSRVQIFAIMHPQNVSFSLWNKVLKVLETKTLPSFPESLKYLFHLQTWYGGNYMCLKPNIAVIFQIKQKSFNSYPNCPTPDCRNFICALLSFMFFFYPATFKYTSSCEGS